MGHEVNVSQAVSRVERADNRQLTRLKRAAAKTLKSKD